ncbi:MAG: ATP-binding protein [Candidatus Aminicenantes bacterium]|nr:ATP-binding protein [Candidatus Aminicenantes bacterium]
MNQLSFRTNVQLKNIIGRDLINNDNIAVLELVKNSYDAGSKKVEVIFKNLKENDDAGNASYSDKSSKIVIIDDGIGMDEEDIKEKWLNIAYSDKKHEKVKDGRVLAGAKGVGRFSCDRLGQYLDLYTKKQGKPLCHLHINWKDFEVEDKKDLEIQDIEIQLDEITEQEFQEKFGIPLEQGTLLEMSKLRSEWATKEKEKKEKKEKWNTSKILDLRRYLEKLINPNQEFGSKGFTIEMIAGDFEEGDALKKAAKLNGEIENKIFEKLNFTTTVIEATIAEDKETEDEEKKIIITTTLTDKGRKVLEVVEENVDYPLLKDIKIVIFYLNPYAKAYFKHQTGIRSVDFGSIFLFINGFRVNPLGDYGDDWLRMELRKGQGYAKFLGSRELVGRIEINDLEGNFKIISSREGVVKDQKFSQLVDAQPSHYGGFFYKTLKRLEKYVVEGLDWDTTRDLGYAIEKLVEDRNWKYNPANEKYAEDESIKNDRILGLLSSLILVDTDPKNVLKIYINEELISRLLLEQKEKARDKFNKLFGDKIFYTKKILDDATWAALNKIRGKLEQKEIELGKKERTLAKKEQEIRILRETKEKLEQDLGKTKEKVQKLETDNIAQKKQIFFLQDHLLQEKKYNQFVNLQHHLGISAGTIENIIVNLQRKISRGAAEKEILLDSLSKITIANKKIKAIVTLITKANLDFDLESLELSNADLTSYILQYLKNVSVKLYEDRLKINVETEIYGSFFQDFNALDITMLFDNLFDNSMKAAARLVTVQIISYSSELVIKIRDDGRGVPPGDVRKIFDFGFSTTHGTGVGLFHVRQILGKLGGEIKLNRDYTRGCEFIIEVRK